MDTSGDIFFVINHAKICGTGKMCVFFLKQDPDPGSGSGFKILICRIRIRPKMDRIRNPDPICVIIRIPYVLCVGSHTCYVKDLVRVMFSIQYRNYVLFGIPYRMCYVEDPICTMIRIPYRVADPDPVGSGPFCRIRIPDTDPSLAI